MNVPLGAMSGAFEGVNASTFAVELGSHIWRIAPYDKPTWVMVDEGTREAVYVAVSQKFDYCEWKADRVVKKAVHKLAMHIYKEFRSGLPREYKPLQSQRNSMSRRQVQTMTHTSGSQSFPQWLSLTPAQEVPSSHAELYQQQHWSKQKNKWITTHAEAKYQGWSWDCHSPR